MYQGYTANLTFIVFEKALKLFVNDVVREALADQNGKVSVAAGAIAGATAGTVQSVVTTKKDV